MADQDHLRQMVLNFRVSELQVLLGFAGRSKSGRKDELQSRALELIKLKSAPVQMKIRELHKRYPSSVRPREPEMVPAGRGPPHGHHLHSSPASPAPPSSIPKTDYSNHHGMLTRSLAPSLPPAAPQVPSPLDFSSSKYAQHHNPSSGSFPLYPDVRFKKLPFYEVLAELLKPATLVPSGSSRFQEANYVFHLTPQQAHDIAISRDLRPSAKSEYQNQIQMRFCLLETSCEQDDYFPPNICVKINGKMCPLPNPVPTNKPGVEPKRPSRPVNITAMAKLSPTVANQLNVTWGTEYARGYAIAIFLVRRMSANQLMNKLRTKGIRNADHTKAMIKEKLTQDADSEIATTSLRVSLLCPLGKRRMQWPCRAVTCSHLQCFDASLYIQMNEKKPTWICPVCDKAAPFDTLVIDGLFTEIFNTTEDCTEIQFFDDGSWSPLVAKKEAHTIGSPIHRGGSNVTNVVTLASESNSNHSVASISSCSSTSTKEKSNKVEVVDLTLDSSDEDEPPKKKSAPISTYSPEYSPEIIGSHCSAPNLGRSCQQVQQQQQLPVSSIPVSYMSSRPSSCSGGVGSASSSMQSGHNLLPRVNMMSSCSSNNSLYRDMPLLDTASSQLYYPPLSCSPYQELLHSPHSALYNFPGYELFNLLGQNEDRSSQLQYGMSTGGMSMPNPVPLPNTLKPTQTPSSSPDVISLD